MPKNKKKIVLEELPAEEKMKYEVAAEMGLLDQVLDQGWQSLSAKETGRIGGVVSRRRKAAANQAVTQSPANSL